MDLAGFDEGSDFSSLGGGPGGGGGGGRFSWGLRFRGYDGAP